MPSVYKWCKYGFMDILEEVQGSCDGHLSPRLRSTVLVRPCPLSQEVHWPGSVLSKGGDSVPEVAEARGPVSRMPGDVVERWGL